VTENEPRFSVELYETSRGQCPVAKFIQRLSKTGEAKCYHELDLLEQFGIELGFPRIKQVTRVLWELRFTADHSAIRLLFLIDENEFIVVHGFKKQSQKIPPRELTVAEQRAADYREHHS
jgi:phage-related protein